MQMRSYLYVPGDNQRFLEKIADSQADAVILDLEDSVKHGSKPHAENMLREFLVSSEYQNLLLRIEPTRLRQQADLINHPNIKKIYLPKSDSRKAIEEFNVVNESNKPIHALIESALGIESLSEISRSKNVQSMGIGEADLFAELSFSGTVHVDLRSYVRSRLVIASAAADLLSPTAPVSGNFKNLEAFESETQQFLDMGYWGRACIHPTQIEIVNKVFNLNPELIEKANKIVGALEQSEGGATVDGEGSMIDAAHMKWAKKLLALQQSIRRA